jgi:hypothetical protein
VASGSGGYEESGADTVVDNAIVTPFGPEDDDNHAGLGSRPRRLGPRSRDVGMVARRPHEKDPCIEPVKPATGDDRGHRPVRGGTAMPRARKPAQVPVPSGPRPPTARETRLALAEVGKYEELEAILKETHPSILDVEEIWSFVLRAMEVRSRQDPERFSADIYAAMVSFSSYMAVRARHVLGRRLLHQGEAVRAGDPAGIDPHLYEDHLPKLVELQGHVAELLQGQATTARSWQMARRGRIENDKAERASSRPTRMLSAEVAAPSEATPAQDATDPWRTGKPVVLNGHPLPTHANGMPKNRLEGLLGVLGSGVGEAPHD